MDTEQTVRERIFLCAADSGKRDRKNSLEERFQAGGGVDQIVVPGVYELCECPSFIFAIRASSSAGLFHSVGEDFVFTLQSTSPEVALGVVGHLREGLAEAVSPL